MIKNILAFIGGLTLLVFTLFISFAGGKIYSEYKEAERIKKLEFANVQKNLNSSYQDLLINGSLCDYTENIENEEISENCKRMESQSEVFKNNLLDLSELMEVKCPSHIRDYINPTLVNLYKFVSIPLEQRKELMISYNSEEIQEALSNTINDISVFDFKSSCKGNGTVIEKVETTEDQSPDYSVPHDNSSFQ